MSLIRTTARRRTLAAGAALLAATAVAPSAAAQCTSGACRTGAHGAACGPGGCQQEDCLEANSRRFRDWRRVKFAGWRMQWEGHLREKALEHPECPPYAAPAFGYHQTCWRPFPEAEIPPCPPTGYPAAHRGPAGFAPPAPGPYPTNLSAPVRPVPAPAPTALDPAAADPAALDPAAAPVEAEDPFDAEDAAPAVPPTPGEPSVPRLEAPLAEPGDLNEARASLPRHNPITPVSAEIPFLTPLAPAPPTSAAPSAAATPPPAPRAGARPPAGRSSLSLATPVPPRDLNWF